MDSKKFHQRIDSRIEDQTLSSTVGVWSPGTTWATNTPSESTTLTAIAMSSDGSIMAATGYGNNGGIWTSTDTGSTWTHVPGLLFGSF